jgi:hypothetical protein
MRAQSLVEAPELNASIGRQFRKVVWNHLVFGSEAMVELGAIDASADALP